MYYNWKQVGTGQIPQKCNRCCFFVCFFGLFVLLESMIAAVKDVEGGMELRQASHIPIMYL